VFRFHVGSAGTVPDFSQEVPRGRRR
jgi:hypothetical protein